MATPPKIWGEPLNFAAGDTLIFEKFLHGYLPADGWSIAGTVTDPNSAKAVANYVSTQSTTDPDSHAVNVPNFAAAVPQGEYILSEEVINATTGEKHQIYYGGLVIGPDLNDQTATAPILTFAQQMINALQAALLAMASDTLIETDVQRNRFRKITEEDKRRQLFIWEERRMNEVNKEGIANGRRNTNDFEPVFRML